MTFMNLSKYLVSALFISLLIIGCSPRKPVDRTGYDEEREVRELKRLTKADLIAKGEEIGKAALKASADALQSNLKNAITEKGVSGAIEFCNLNASGLVKSIEDSLGVTVMRVTDKTRNLSDTLTVSDQDIWDAYSYESPESPQLLEIDEETFVMTKAIKIPSGLCLNCHGTPGETITDENYALIKSLYPDDLAIGYNVGDLRGMWKITIPKKSVVEKL